MEKILDKFLRYVAVDTMSDPDSPSQPSTQKQFNLLNLLCEELKAMGVENVSVDQYGYLMATIPSNIEKDVPAIGFIAHVDSSPDASGADIKPQVFENYDGGWYRKNDRLIFATYLFSIDTKDLKEGEVCCELGSNYDENDIKSMYIYHKDMLIQM